MDCKSNNNVGFVLYSKRTIPPTVAIETELGLSDGCHYTTLPLRHKYKLITMPMNSNVLQQKHMSVFSIMILTNSKTPNLSCQHYVI